MRTPCCHAFLAFLIKVLNFLQTFFGLSVILYSVYMLNQWHNHRMPPPPSAPSPNYLDTPLPNFDIPGLSDLTTPLSLAADLASGLHSQLNLDFRNLPAPWFIYAFMGVGIIVCCITCTGHVAAEAINGCCLCFYALLTTLLVLLEAALVAFIALDRQWEKDLPFDPTGEIDNLRAFIKDNIDICKWVGIALLIVQALSLLLAIILRAMVSSQSVDDEIEGDYDVRGRTQEPLLNPQINQASGSINSENRGAHSDFWSSRMRDKYGLGGSDATYNLQNHNRSTDGKSLS